MIARIYHGSVVPQWVELEHCTGLKPERAPRVTPRVAARWSHMPIGHWTGKCSTGGLANRQLPRRGWSVWLKLPSLVQSKATRPSGERLD